MHSVLGAFGLNSSIYDAVNLSWKLGLSIKGAADAGALLPTYDAERRLFANRVIRCSGAYLRFICNLDLPLASLRGLAGDALESHEENLPLLDGTAATDRRWLKDFFARNAMFLLGVDGVRVSTPLSPDDAGLTVDHHAKTNGTKQQHPAAAAAAQRPISVLNGVRAPDPRVCLAFDGSTTTGHLYDAMPGVDKFHIVVFGSNLRGPVRERLAEFSSRGLGNGGGGFFTKFGGRQRFNVVLVCKMLPHEADEALAEGPDLRDLRGLATVVYDDRQPDESAHYWYGVNHARGAVVVVRPDLVVGMSAWPEDPVAVDEYLSGFLIPAPQTNGT